LMTIWKQSDSKKSPGFYTVFLAEIIAINETANWLLEFRELYATRLKKLKTVVIHCDSQAALRSLEKSEVDDSLVHNCIKALNVLARHYTVKLTWIKAHVGHEFNEKVDMAAKDGANGNSRNIIIEKEQKITLKRFNNHLQLKLNDQWNHNWAILNQARQTRELFPEVDMKFSNKLLCMQRKDIYLILQMLTGHNVLNRHLKLIGWEDIGNCPDCSEEEDSSAHILLRCPRYAEIRRITFDHSFLRLPLPDDFKWNAKDLLLFIHHLGDRLKYTKDTPTETEDSQLNQTRPPKRKKKLTQENKSKRAKFELTKDNKQRRCTAKMEKDRLLQLSIKNFLIKDREEESKDDNQVRFTAKRQLSIHESFANATKRPRLE